MPRTVPVAATQTAGSLITSALWNASVAAGVAFLTGVPLFRGRQTIAQNTASGAWNPMGLDVTDIDTDSGHSNSINNSRYVGQVPGWYWVEGYAAWQAAGATCRFEAAIFKNSSAVPGSAQFLVKPTSDLAALSASTLVYLNGLGDYVETQGRQNSGSTITTQDGTDLCPAMNVYWLHS